MAVNPEISKYFSELSKKRLKPYYGFQDPKVQKKIQKVKRDRKTLSKVQQADKDNQDQG